MPFRGGALCLGLIQPSGLIQQNGLIQPNAAYWAEPGANSYRRPAVMPGVASASPPHRHCRISTLPPLSSPEQVQAVVL